MGRVLILATALAASTNQGCPSPPEPCPRGTVAFMGACRDGCPPSELTADRECGCPEGTQGLETDAGTVCLEPDELPGSDMGPADAASDSGEACTPGQECRPTACMVGVTECPGGALVCADQQAVSDGTTCDSCGAAVCRCHEGFCESQLSRVAGRLKRFPADPSDVLGFGSLVALRADGRHVAVVASDRVQLLERGADGLQEAPALLLPSVLASGARAIAMSGDGNVLALGFPFDGSSASGVLESLPEFDGAVPGAGGVLIYRRSGAGSFQVDAYVKAPAPSEGDALGFALALDEDGTNLIVGAPGRAFGGVPRSGEVLVYRREAAGGWRFEAALGAAQPQSGSRLGEAVAVTASGALVAAGSPGDPTSSGGVSPAPDALSPFSGAIHVFSSAEGTWSPGVLLKAPRPDTGDRVGASVAISPDGSRLVAGAPGEDSSSAELDDDLLGDSGAVFAFEFSLGAWSYDLKVKAPDPDEGDEFGRSVTLASDGALLFVGVGEEDGGSSDFGGDPARNDNNQSGAVFGFRRSAEGFVRVLYLKAPLPGTDFLFGEQVVSSRDGRVLVVGSPGEALGGAGLDPGDVTLENSAGAVYVYE